MNLGIPGRKGNGHRALARSTIDDLVDLFLTSAVAGAVTAVPVREGVALRRMRDDQAGLCYLGGASRTEMLMPWLVYPCHDSLS